ncbi:MAG: hypothetical protein R3E82_00510 [Pseudomonadales bacterium]|nr:hypothetical protein [Pseudomonadales bacterium]
MDIAVKLATDIGPQLTSKYHAASSGMMTMLLLALAQDADRAVANRFADVAELRDLFKAGSDAPGAEARGAFTASEPAGLLLSQVTDWHSKGMSLLIELHAWAEVHDPELDRQIWDFLRNHTERNRFDV